VIVVGIGGYLGAIFGTPKSAEPLWWLASYAVFVALNVYGVELSFRVSVVITLIALAVLVVFWIAAIPRMDFARYALDVVPRAGNSKWFPGGMAGVLAQLPFALWFLSGDRAAPLGCGRIA
jgi:ethanolamine permease